MKNWEDEDVCSWKRIDLVVMICCQHRVVLVRYFKKVSK